MKITNLDLENFKCIKSASIEIKPITLFTGANSSGKSSMLSSMLACFQGTGSNKFPFSFTPNGDLCTLADYRSLVYKHNVSNKIKISMDITDKLGKYSYSSTFKNSRKKFKFHPVDIKVHTKHGDFTLAYSDESEKYAVHIKIDPKNFENIASTVKFLEIISTLALKDSNSSAYEMKKIEHNISPGGKYTKNIVVKSLSALFNELFKDPVTGPMLMAASLDLEGYKHNIHYVGPSRFYPSRIYLNKNLSNTKILPDGSNVVEVLADWKESSPKKFMRVIHLGKSLGMYQDLQPKRLPDGLLQLTVKATKSQTTASLQDVGFGISQILPIITTEVLAENNTIIFLSQPELHLHPSAQSNLSELFAASCKERGRQYIVETHSEYMITKFRALVASKKLSPDDVVIYHMCSSDGALVPVKITISPEGKLENAPKDYFDTYRTNIFDILMAE